MNKSRTF